MENSGLLEKEGRTGRGKNRHNLIRWKLSVNSVLGSIQEPIRVSVPGHQGLGGRLLCEWPLGKPGWALLLPPRAPRSLELRPCAPWVPFVVAAGARTAPGPLLQPPLVSP